MPKPIVFQFGESEITFTISKVDRSKLYGFKELKALDEKDEVCELVTLAGDAAYALHYTDFSPNRKEPLSCNVQVSESREQMDQLFQQCKADNIKTGWRLRWTKKQGRSREEHEEQGRDEKRE